MQRKMSALRLTYICLFWASLLIASCANNPVQDANDQTLPTITPIPTAPAAARPAYTVQRGTVQETLAFSGRWLPRDQMTLAFPIAGTVRQVNVRQGDTVNAGQLLADFQITDLEDQLASAELDLQRALASLESGTGGTVKSVTDAEIALANARLSLESTKGGSPWIALDNARISLEDSQRALNDAQRAYDEALSHPEQPASAVDSAYKALESARSNLRTAQNGYFSAAQSFNNHQISVQQQENAVLAAEIALENARSGAGSPDDQQAVLSAQLRVDQIKADIARASLYAPIDAEVLEVIIKPGDNAEAFRTVITLALPEPKEVLANLSVNDTQRLSAGLVGKCQVINQPETAVGCVVRRLPLSSRDADQTTRIAAALESPTSGQLIEVEMPLQVREDVLWLPPTAIRTFQNRTFVVLQTPDGQRSVDVVIGLRTDERVEIISGVSEGDVVVGP